MTSIRRLPLFPSAGSRRAEWAARVREKAFLNIWTKRWSVSHFDQGVLVEEGRCLRKGIRSVRTMSECAYRLCVVLGTPRRGACRCARLDARARGVRSANGRLHAGDTGADRGGGQAAPPTARRCAARFDNRPNGRDAEGLLPRGRSEPIR